MEVVPASIASVVFASAVVCSGVVGKIGEVVVVIICVVVVIVVVCVVDSVIGVAFVVVSSPAPSVVVSSPSSPSSMHVKLGEPDAPPQVKVTCVAPGLEY